MLTLSCDYVKSRPVIIEQRPILKPTTEKQHGKHTWEGRRGDYRDAAFEKQMCKHLKDSFFC